MFIKDLPQKAELLLGRVGLLVLVIHTLVLNPVRTRRTVDSLGPMRLSNLFDYACHDRILANLSSFFMLLDHLIEPDVAHNIASEQDKIRSKDLFGVKFPHRIAYRPSFTRDDGCDGHARAWFRPLRVTKDEIRVA
ncbi:unnamed protein product [Rhizoctonia solani]|uniref:Uncharacterized protein n=1 Tax=Rhizoctonia solani TaxID=456999 RepID=A0A8H2X680_9AGAM|nr:unnamed protein product [Rhizoctonia solani]